MKTLRYALFLLVFATTLSSCNEPPVLQSNHFSLSAKNIETMRATLEISSKDNSMFYYVGLLPKWKLEQIGGKDSVSGYDIENCKYEALLQGKTWQDYFREQLRQGNASLDTRADLKDTCLQWNTDYVLYCYGLNKESLRIITEVYTLDFRTLKPTASSNSIVVNITEKSGDGIKATVTPSNSDQYLLAFQPASYVEDFLQKKTSGELVGGMQADEYMVWDIVRNFWGDKLTLKSGNFTIEKSTELTGVKVQSSQHYYLILTGFHDGVSTEVQAIKCF